MNSSFALVWGEFMSLLALTALTCTAVLMPLANPEVLTHIQNSVAQAESDPSAPTVQESVLLEVQYVASGKYQYFLKEQQKADRTFSQFAEVSKALNESRPQHLRLRIDRQVESGVYQDILVEAARLGISTWQQNNAK